MSETGWYNNDNNNNISNNNKLFIDNFSFYNWKIKLEKNVRKD